MSPRAPIATPVLVAAVLTGCMGGARDRAADTAADGITPPILSGTSWLLVDLAGTPALPNPQATLEFPDTGRVAGKASCNRFFGSVQLSDATITFGALGSTRMACADPINRQESAYLTALQAGESYEIVGDTLRIYMKGATAPLRFLRQASAASFRDPTGIWTITGHLEPGISAMSSAEADALKGRTLQYGIAEAIAGPDTCVAPAYARSTVPADSLLQAGYRISAASLGIATPDQARLGRTEVTCDGKPWASLGGMLLQVTDDRAFAVHDGVFFQLERQTH